MAKILPKAEAIVPKQAQFLLSAAPPVAQEFAKIAVNIILKGDVAARGYAKAASALQITVDAVDQGVKMLRDIFIRSAQSNLSAVQMTEFLKDLGFHNETRECLVDYCSQRFREIRGLVAVPRLNVSSYRKLEWRLDVQLGSRSLFHQTDPSFLLKLSLNREHVGGVPSFGGKQSQSKALNNERTEKKVIYLEANYATLKTGQTSLAGCGQSLEIIPSNRVISSNSRQLVPVQLSSTHLISQNRQEVSIPLDEHQRDEEEWFRSPGSSLAVRPGTVGTGMPFRAASTNTLYNLTGWSHPAQWLNMHPAPTVITRPYGLGAPVSLAPPVRVRSAVAVSSAPPRASRHEEHRNESADEQAGPHQVLNEMSSLKLE